MGQMVWELGSSDGELWVLWELDVVWGLDRVRVWLGWDRGGIWVGMGVGV